MPKYTFCVKNMHFSFLPAAGQNNFDIQFTFSLVSSFFLAYELTKFNKKRFPNFLYGAYFVGGEEI
jgi:hypothetical protein